SDFITNPMHLLSVLRDIYAAIPGSGKHTINSAYAFGGPELLRKTLDNNLGINPEYYAVVDFPGFENLIDELMPAGVPFNVEKDMSNNIGV
ncbi:LCP family protein, partial [Staphylococcus aureus]